MTPFRFIPYAIALASAGALIGCANTPAMSTSPASPSMAAPDAVAKMDAQMKTMREMHEKMMAAKSAEERSRLMPEHMKAMQDGMGMMAMKDGMKPMKGMPGMSAEMSAHHQMMNKRMEMMQAMMTMMQDHMTHAPAK